MTEVTEDLNKEEAVDSSVNTNDEAMPLDDQVREEPKIELSREARLMVLNEI